ncbi:MAG: phosphodiester glycosidase family protein [Rhizobacter sp.]|nr:phosphodiester glycosidase family protein [Ferruginibacter sp.]
MSQIKSITKLSCLVVLVLFFKSAAGQTQWRNVDTDFGILPAGFHVFCSTDSLEGKPFRAFYAIADLQNKQLDFSTDTTHQRRLTPTKFYEKNKKPFLVVNTTFFSFATNQNLNLVIKNGKMVGYNIHSLPGKGKDAFTYRHAFNGAIGISKKRRADIAWIYSDSSKKYPLAVQQPIKFYVDSFAGIKPGWFKIKNAGLELYPTGNPPYGFTKWKMQTAVAGGPVLVQAGEINISNNEELKFNGKAISDKHPRTLMGYTREGKLIVMVVEGRNSGVADGVSLTQSAQLMKDIGCIEAINLDGGGSSCMLINGKETIRPSDKAEQRPVPAVFIIRTN